MTSRDVKTIHPMTSAMEVCADYQDTSAAFARDAAFYLSRGQNSAAIQAQQYARIYHDAAFDRLARIIGVG